MLQCVELFASTTTNVKKDHSLQFVLTLLSDLTEVREGGGEGGWEEATEDVVSVYYQLHCAGFRCDCIASESC